MIRKSRLFFPLVAILAIASCSDGNSVPPADSSLPTSFHIPGEAVFPEGIAYNDRTGKFYTGSTQDGTLFEGDLATGEVTVFSEGGSDGRIAATGMKIDKKGRLWVAGAMTGQMFVYDTGDGNLIASYQTPAADVTFINDVALAPNGDAYFTDSFRPYLFRISGTAGGTVDPWLDFTGTALEYEQGFNLNGIAFTGDGHYMFVVHSGNGGLFRIDSGTKEVIEVDLGAGALVGGDGLLLDGNTLYVVLNSSAKIVPVTLSDDFSEGEVGEGMTDESFQFPTTIAKVDDTFLVVISQINKREETPELPFTVMRIPLIKESH
jgi:sugar lactone lactonase YvrE